MSALSKYGILIKINYDEPAWRTEIRELKSKEEFKIWFKNYWHGKKISEEMKNTMTDQMLFFMAQEHQRNLDDLLLKAIQESEKSK